MVSSERLSKLADSLFAALRGGDYDRALELFAPQATWWMNGDFRGPASVVLPRMKDLGNRVGYRTHEEVRRVFGKDAFVEQHVARWNGPDGQARDLPACAVVEVGDDGLVTRFDEYFDSAAFAAATAPSIPAKIQDGPAPVEPEPARVIQSLQLNPAATALLLMDLQGGVATIDTSPRSVADVVRCASGLAAVGRGAGALVIWVRGGGEPDGADAWRPDSELQSPRGPRPAGWDQLLPELGVLAGDLVITKRQWGAFYGTDVDLQLRRRRIDTLVMGGVATNFVVESTARDAGERGYRLLFVEDAMAARSLEEHHYPLTRIFPRLGHVVDASAVETLLKSSAVPSTL